MSGQLDWQVFEEGDGWLPEQSDFPPIHKQLGNRTFWLFAIVFFCLIVGGWGLYQQQLSRQESKLRAEVQSILDFEEEAFQAGDGDLFFSVQDDDPAWVSAQLQPGNQGMYRANGRVSKVEAHGDEVWANVVWREEDKLQQRIAFFRWQNGRFLHVPTSNSYWGPVLREDTDWGQLSYAEIDQPWVNAIDRFMAESIAELCVANCLRSKLPLILVLTTDYSQTAVPHHLFIPSPRLVALGADGRPADKFWQRLYMQLEGYLTPAVIRFAVLAPRGRYAQTLINYEQAATQFMAEHPDITVEVVYLEKLPEDAATLALAYDGAVYLPDKAMLTAGLVRDLTDLANSDPDFDQADFYEQIWQGGQWYGRLWVMPLAAEMPVLYYDKTAYKKAGMPEPSMRWTWVEMERDTATIVATQPENCHLAWGYLDTGLNSLYSYAWNWGNNCRGGAARMYWRQLPPQNVAAALNWYKERVSQPGQMADVCTSTEKLLGRDAFLPSPNWIGGEQRFVLWNIQTSQRKAAVWVDSPLNYEAQLLLAPLGVVPFPGSDCFDGITPLWVQGAFISQQSERPYAVWQWLKFLSRQSPSLRLVPARPSVAEATGYWTYLPRPLGNAMRTAFPFARPVTIEDQTRLTWEQVTAVTAGQLSPAEAAQQPRQLPWFGSSTRIP